MALIMKKLVLDGTVSSKSHARADVLRLQFALNTIATAWGGPKKSLPFDGQYTKQLAEAVKGFQTHCFSNSKKSTGEITPNDATHQKINQVLAGAVDLVAVTSHGGNAVEIGAKAYGTEIRFDGLTDLVNKVNSALNSNAIDPEYNATNAVPKKIANLSISSHGCAGYMHLSTAGMAEDLILAQYAFDDVVNYAADELGYNQAATLTGLSGKFVRSGLVTLSACRVAAPSRQVNKKQNFDYSYDGRNFLKAISKALGNVAVQGGTAKQDDTDFGMEGPCYRCDSHYCTIVHPRNSSFFGPEFSLTDEFGEHFLEDEIAESSLTAVSHLPPSHPEKQRLLQRLFNRKRTR